MPRLVPTFVTGPDRPLDRPEIVFFPATSNDGPAKTVSTDLAPYVQAADGTQEGVPVALNRPVQYVQILRVYNPSRRMFPKAF